MDACHVCAEPKHVLLIGNQMEGYKHIHELQWIFLELRFLFFCRGNAKRSWWRYYLADSRFSHTNAGMHAPAIFFPGKWSPSFFAHFFPEWPISKCSWRKNKLQPSHERPLGPSFISFRFYGVTVKLIVPKKSFIIFKINLFALISPNMFMSRISIVTIFSYSTTWQCGTLFSPLFFCFL